MFARTNRFSFRNSFPRKVIQTPFFTIRYDLESKHNYECAVVVGKKVNKKATSRNKLKRKIVFAVKEIVPHDVNLRIVIYAKKSINDKEFEELKNDLENSLKEIR